MRCARACALAVTAMLGVTSTASAHAVLESTSPQRGAVVKRQPAQVSFRFGEPVEGNFGAVRVFGARGVRVDQGNAFHPDGTGSELAVHLKADLPRGTYTATYRVVSADSHIVSGGIVFSIGSAAEAGDTIAHLLGDRSAGTLTQIALGAARAIQYAAIAGGIGLLAFLVLIWMPAIASVAGADERWGDASVAFVGRLRRAIIAVALLGVFSALAAVVLEAASAAGISAWAALAPSVLRDELGTRFGTIWTLGALAWVLLGGLAGMLLGADRKRAVLRAATLGATGLALAAIGLRRVLPLAIPSAFLVMLPALAGHGTTQDPVAVMLPANVVHVASVSLWVGGLAALLLVLPAATNELDGEDRTRLLSAALLRFSPLALGAVCLVLATGLVQSFVEVRHLNLIFSTPFGRAAFIKLVLLFVLIGLGALNRRRTLPRLERAAADGETPGEGGVVVRRTLRAELALVVVVFGVTGALASYAPAIAGRSERPEPVAITTSIGPEQLRLNVDPAITGLNAVDLRVLDPETGAPFTATRQLTVQATQTEQGIGPLDLRAAQRGQGHYRVRAAPLHAPGIWQLDVTLRVSAFAEFSKSVKVKIR